MRFIAMFITAVCILFLRNGRTIEVPLYELWSNTTLLIPSLFDLFIVKLPYFTFRNNFFQIYVM